MGEGVGDELRHLHDGVDCLLAVLLEGVEVFVVDVEAARHSQPVVLLAALVPHLTIINMSSHILEELLRLKQERKAVIRATQDRIQENNQHYEEEANSIERLVEWAKQPAKIISQKDRNVVQPVRPLPQPKDASPSKPTRDSWDGETRQIRKNDGYRNMNSR